MKAGGSIEAEYDIPPDAWYFAANRGPSMPHAVLLEAALQSCGFLAAYIGSALTSPDDLCFRNLGGEARQFLQVTPQSGTLATRVTVTRVSTSAGMIIQHYDFTVRCAGQVVYDGNTYFGFFTRAALAEQVGIRDAGPYQPSERERAAGQSFGFPAGPPFPDRPLRMLDRVDLLVPDGGPTGLGFIQGSKVIDPQEWFFSAHFHQDPVWPGSLGLEAFLQLLQVIAVRRWGVGLATLAHGKPHRWVYRGQVVPGNRLVTVGAIVKGVDDRDWSIEADGSLWVDGLLIYQMKDVSASFHPGEPAA
jgi:3-hydroxymyristoyl/3-hydroxydecanoyl-(acyl carrier protein) dehydratase